MAQLLLGTSETSGRHLYPFRAIDRTCLLIGPGPFHEGVSSAQSRGFGCFPPALVCSDMLPLLLHAGRQQWLARLAAVTEGWQLGHRPTSGPNKIRFVANKMCVSVRTDTASVVRNTVEI